MSDKSGKPTLNNGRLNARSLWSARSALPPGARRHARAAVDRVLSPVAGSVNRSDAQSAMALTLDDGPDPEVTPALIDRFAELGVRATFFVLTLRAEKRPDLVLRLVEAGHEIALHGLDHRRVTAMPGADVEGYLLDAKTRLENVAGQPVTMFRPPYGSQSIRSVRAAGRAGLRVVVWSGDAEDWVDRDPESVVEDAVNASQPGGILLFHERLEPDPTHPDAARAAPTTTFDRISVLTEIVHRLRAQGVNPSTVGDLARVSNMRRTAWIRP